MVRFFFPALRGAVLRATSSRDGTMTKRHNKKGVVKTRHVKRHGRKSKGFFSEWGLRFLSELTIDVILAIVKLGIK